MSIACSDGGWTAWGFWGTCSITCGGGFRSRSRTCTNPIPSLSGKYCKGDTIQVGACSNNVCKEPNVAFRSKDVVSTIPHSGQTIVFKTATLNEGSGYDKTTGIFTAPVAGTYLFSIQLCVEKGHDVDYAIVVDGVNVKVGHFSDATWELCYSAETVAILRSGSRVWVKCDYDTCYLHQRTHYSNTFSGVLIHS
ncbi:complement C1q-like protein 2 [Mercenaria mercenaria]|uniref:complement C1q-like protein 2 n=1 Tax=Mercenaria mercenaria TaxID=6596 RepID=UPI00234E8553|nr:complement C1q-like protein 2 [Mercenaria mercenaria]